MHEKGTIPAIQAALSPRWRRAVLFVAAAFLLILGATYLHMGPDFERVPSSYQHPTPPSEAPAHKADETQAKPIQSAVEEPVQSPPPKPKAKPTERPTAKPDEECAGFPDTSRVLILLKTGASETFKRLPISFATMLKCMPDNVLVWSDMAETIAGHKVYDSLETVLETVKSTNNDFKLYNRQKNCPIAVEDCNKHHQVGVQGWNLDKYKNPHIAERVYKSHPNYDWYFYIDADTYVSWTNLVQWLKSVDPAKPHYIGSIEYNGHFPFAHGGSGYFMSKAAMDSMFAGKTGLANEYDEKMSHHCCGDIMWSEIMLNETGLEPENMWPVLNGRKANTLRFSEKQWCHPVITLHKLIAEEIHDMYNFETAFHKAGNGTLRLKDVYNHFLDPHIEAKRQDWDNGSQDSYYVRPDIDLEERQDDEWKDLADKAKTEDLSEVEEKAHESFENCEAACAELDECFQFRYHDGVCGIGHTIKHGVMTGEEDDEEMSVYSGWRVDKIREWVKDQGDCESEEFKWPIKDV